MKCGTCNTTINFNAGQDAEVTLPPGAEPTAVVAGGMFIIIIIFSNVIMYKSIGAWSFLHRLFKRTQEQPVPLEKKLRKQVMCNTCKVSVVNINNNIHVLVITVNRFLIVVNVDNNGTRENV